MIPLRLNINTLIGRLSDYTGQRWSQRRLAEEAKVNKDSLSRMARGDAKRVDIDDLGKILAVFYRYGMDVHIQDLIGVDMASLEEPEARQLSLVS